MNPRTRFIPSLAVALGFSALGCSGGSEAPDSTERQDTEHCTEDLVGAVDPDVLIDDLEDGDARIAEVGGRNGSWWLATDGTDGTITPMGDQEAPPERIVGGRCGSKYAMRVSGEGFTGWGASLILSLGLDADEFVPFDASAYRGVMMWARIGKSNTSTIRVQFQDGNTYPQGGVCNPDPAVTDDCFNGFGSALLPTSTEWQLYKLDFSRMGQRDFGLRTDALDTGNLYAIEIGVTAAAVFDFWIDDVWFYE